VSPEYARLATGGNITLQGNFDPSMLLASPEQITIAVHRMIDRFSAQRYVVNLGHGITPNVPVANAQAFVDAVKSWSPH
jgi:uroporphyrinogen decarboxylase